mmetsp:Transcript_45692/g.148531  ORF Transcript_45692/g.148531 Transcript_45692/m.148531 type:complete len:209 (-) Transcript_45692:128-754(-)
MPPTTPPAKPGCRCTKGATLEPINFESSSVRLPSPSMSSEPACALAVSCSARTAARAPACTPSGVTQFWCSASPVPTAPTTAAVTMAPCGTQTRGAVGAPAMRPARRAEERRARGDLLFLEPSRAFLEESGRRLSVCYFSAAARRKGLGGAVQRQRSGRGGRAAHRRTMGGGAAGGARPLREPEASGRAIPPRRRTRHRSRTRLRGRE